MDAKVVKSEEFALRIVKLCSFLKDKGEYVMSKQILRSGTSIGANIAESVYAESHDDMIHKLSISLKEASETKYWLNLLHRSEYLPLNLYNSILEDCTELIKILTSIINTLKSAH